MSYKPTGRFYGVCSENNRLKKTRGRTCVFQGKESVINNNVFNNKIQENVAQLKS